MEFHKPAPLEGHYASQKDSTVTVSYTGMQYSTAPVAHIVRWTPPASARRDYLAEAHEHHVQLDSRSFDV